MVMKNGHFFIYFRPIEDTREDASTSIKLETLTTTPPYVIQAYELLLLKTSF